MSHSASNFDEAGDSRRVRYDTLGTTKIDAKTTGHPPRSLGSARPTAGGLRDDEMSNETLGCGARLASSAHQGSGSSCCEDQVPRESRSSQRHSFETQHQKFAAWIRVVAMGDKRTGCVAFESGPWPLTKLIRQAGSQRTRDFFLSKHH